MSSPSEKAPMLDDGSVSEIDASCSSDVSLQLEAAAASTGSDQQAGLSNPHINPQLSLTSRSNSSSMDQQSTSINVLPPLCYAKTQSSNFVNVSPAPARLSLPDGSTSATPNASEHYDMAMSHDPTSAEELAIMQANHEQAAENRIQDYAALEQPFACDPISVLTTANEQGGLLNDAIGGKLITDDDNNDYIPAETAKPVEIESITMWKEPAELMDITYARPIEFTNQDTTSKSPLDVPGSSQSPNPEEPHDEEVDKTTEIAVKTFSELADLGIDIPCNSPKSAMIPQTSPSSDVSRSSEARDTLRSVEPNTDEVDATIGLYVNTVGDVTMINAYDVNPTAPPDLIQLPREMVSGKQDVSRVKDHIIVEVNTNTIAHTSDTIHHSLRDQRYEHGLPSEDQVRLDDPIVDVAKTCSGLCESTCKGDSQDGDTIDSEHTIVPRCRRGPFSAVSVTEEELSITTESLPHRDKPIMTLANGEDHGKVDAVPSTTKLLPRSVCSTEEISLVSDAENTHDEFRFPKVKYDISDRKMQLVNLVTLAVARSSGRCLSLEGLIEKTAQLWDISQKQSAHTSETDKICLRNPVERMLHQYDTPTIPVLKDNQIHFKLANGAEWWILNHMRQRKHEEFDLLKLPVELRLEIYVWTLCHPLPENQGWTLESQDTENTTTKYINHARPSHYFTTPGPGNWKLRTRSLNRLLAITRVSKKIRAESLPVFFRTNYFAFSQPKNLGRFLRAIPYNHWYSIRNVILHYDPPDHAHECRRSFVDLLDCKVRSLHIKIDEDAMLVRHNADCVAQLPGLKVLGYLRGVESVTFGGNFEKVEKLLLKDYQIMEPRKHEILDEDEKADLYRIKQNQRNLTQLQKVYGVVKRERQRDARKNYLQEQQQAKKRKAQLKGQKRYREKELVAQEKTRRQEEINEQRIQRKQDKELEKADKTKARKAKQSENRVMKAQEKAIKDEVRIKMKTDQLAKQNKKLKALHKKNEANLEHHRVLARQLAAKQHGISSKRKHQDLGFNESNSEESSGSEYEDDVENVAPMPSCKKRKW